MMAVADRHGLPVAIHIESATPHEVKLAVPTLLEMLIPEAPRGIWSATARMTPTNSTQNSATTAYTSFLHIAATERTEPEICDA